MGTTVYAITHPNARATAAQTRMKIGPCVDHRSRMSRKRSSPKNGVIRPATRIMTSMARMALSARDVGAASKSVPPRMMRRAAAAYSPDGLWKCQAILRSVPGETTPIAPRIVTNNHRAIAIRAMLISTRPNAKAQPPSCRSAAEARRLAGALGSARDRVNCLR